MKYSATDVKRIRYMRIFIRERGGERGGRGGERGGEGGERERERERESIFINVFSNWQILRESI